MKFRVNYYVFYKETQRLHPIGQRKDIQLTENDVDFDIYDDSQWKIYLSQYKDQDGKPLPRVTQDKEPICYRVFEAKRGFPTIFPKKGTKLYPAGCLF